MKLSSKGRYGVQAIFDIAFHSGANPAQIKDISERQEIPARFLEQVFQDLKRAGLLRSKRGPRGGYQLALPAEEIRLGDIIRALEGPVTLGSPQEPETRSTSSEAVLQDVFGQLCTRIEACFDGITVADLCARAGELGLETRARHSGNVYAI